MVPMCLSIKTMPTPKELEFSQQYSCWEKEKGEAWCQPEGGFVSQEEMSPGSDNLSDHSVQLTGTEGAMGQ